MLKTMPLYHKSWNAKNKFRAKLTTQYKVFLGIPWRHKLMSMLMQLLLDRRTKEPLSISGCTGVIRKECTGLLRCTDVKNAGVWVYCNSVYGFTWCTDVNFLGVWVFRTLVYGGLMVYGSSIWGCTGVCLRLCSTMSSFVVAKTEN